MSKDKKEKEEAPVFPEHVSWGVIDAWLAIPPCTYKEKPYCHVDCPYFADCWPDKDGYEDDWG